MGSEGGQTVGWEGVGLGQSSSCHEEDNYNTSIIAKRLQFAVVKRGVKKLSYSKTSGKNT